MTKIDGLKFLKKYDLPTVELLTIDDLLNDKSLLKYGISVRLSSKVNNVDVGLKSIHGVHNIDEIINFIHQYKNDYNFIIHKTVKPSMIGTISKFNNHFTDVIAIEMYNNFENRKNGIVDYRAYAESIENRIIKLYKENFYSIKVLEELIKYAKDIYFEEFTVEFVLENDKVIFTDFYSNDFYCENDYVLKKHR